MRAVSRVVDRVRAGRRPATAGGIVDELRPVAARPLRVLIVDDNRDFADVSLLLIQLWGHDGRAAYGGREALDVVEVFQPDVFLLDIGMPWMNGYELARNLRGRFREALLVAVTGYADPAHRARGEEAGFDRYLIKPVDPPVLETLLSLEWQRLTAHERPRRVERAATC